MSFGPSQAIKNNQNSQAGITNQANVNSGALNNLGGGQLATGAGNVASGSNWFNTILNGNQANTASLLAPSLNADRAQTQSALQSASTLMPRGGGRSATLFNLNMQPTTSIQDMFNNARTTAAQALPQIGLQQQGIGTNLFGLGNQALNTASGSNQALSQSLWNTQNRLDSLVSGLMKGILGLATLPFGGGTTAGAGELGGSF